MPFMIQLILKEAQARQAQWHAFESEQHPNVNLLGDCVALRSQAAESSSKEAAFTVCMVWSSPQKHLASDH